MFTWNEFFEQYLKNTPPDHEGIAYTCDPHHFDYIAGTNPY